MYIVLQDLYFAPVCYEEIELKFRKKHCSLIALLQQSPAIVLIEEERTLFNTTNPYKDINNQSFELGHCGRMENSKVMIYFIIIN